MNINKIHTNNHLTSMITTRCKLVLIEEELERKIHLLWNDFIVAELEYFTNVLRNFVRVARICASAGLQICWSLQPLSVIIFDAVFYWVVRSRLFLTTRHVNLKLSSSSLAVLWEWDAWNYLQTVGIPVFCIKFILKNRTKITSSNTFTNFSSFF